MDFGAGHLGTKLFIIACVLLSGCEKDRRIHGTVRDIFGTPLAGVEVKINNTAFRSASNEVGSFGIDYAPGQFTLRIAKQGFTTLALDINISQKSDYPIGDVVLVPLPPEADAVYLFDERKKSLVHLPSLATVVRSEKNAGWMESDVSFSLNYKNEVIESLRRGDDVPDEPELTVGTVRFVGADLDESRLLRLRSGEGGLLHSFQINSMGREDVYYDAPSEEALPTAALGLDD